LYAPYNAKIVWWDSSTNTPSPHPDIQYPQLATSAAYLCVTNNCSLPILTTGELKQNIIDLTKSSSKKVISESSTQDKAEAILLHNNLIYSLLAFWLFGLLLAFTPCVLPLILVIAGFLGGRSHEITKREMIFLALTYVLTLAMTYAIAGICTALFGYYLQAELHKPWIIILASMIFFILSLSMLGFYKLQLPANMRHHLLKFNRFQNHYTHLQVALMAIIATLIAAPCLAAPLVGALSYVGKTGDVILGGVALFALGIGISTPLFIATIVGVNLIPKSTAFQQINKTFFGLILLGVAIWLLSSILSSFITMALWSLVFIYFGIYLYFVSNFENHIQLVSKAIGVIILTYGISIFVGALLGNNDPVDPLESRRSEQIHSTEFTNIASTIDLNNEFNLAKQFNKPILLYFYSAWCESCKELKKTVFSDPKLKDIFNQFLLASVDVSKFNADIQKITDQYNIMGTPEMLFFDSQGNNLIDQRVGGYIDAIQLTVIMEEIIHGLK
jgi:thiol:disulfide interchange protein DsbD